MLVLVGKSCTGKSTIQKILIEEYGMERTVTYTSRPPREGEVDGVDYNFVNLPGKNYFDDRFIFCGIGMAEVTEYNVASGETWFYGSTLRSYEKSDNKVIILNPDGLKAVKKLNIPIFAVEITSPENSIRNRQLDRGDEPKEAARRRKQDIIDFANLSSLVNVVVTNCGDNGPDRCARNIFDIYQHWRVKHVEDLS